MREVAGAELRFGHHQLQVRERLQRAEQENSDCKEDLIEKMILQARSCSLETSQRPVMSSRCSLGETEA